VPKSKSYYSAEPFRRGN